MEYSSRIRKQTQKYGTTVQNLSKQSDESDPYGDDSFDDKTYSPESDNQKNVSMSSQSDENISVVITNFDNQFENIERNSKIDRVPISSTNFVGNFSLKETADENIPKKSSDSFQLEVLYQLKMLNERSLETAKRVAVIEESMIKGNRIISLKKEAAAHNELNLFNDFAKLKKMPYNAVEDFKKFEESLNEITMVEAVRTFHNKLETK